MKGPTSAIRFSNATSLLDYGFNNYSYKSFGTQGEVVKSVVVTKGLQQSVNAIYETSPSFLIKKGEESGITYELNLNDIIQAPVSQGQQLGSIKYYLNGTELETVALVAETSVEKTSLSKMTIAIINKWFNFLRI